MEIQMIRFFYQNKQLDSPYVTIHSMYPIDLRALPDDLTPCETTWKGDLPTGLQADSLHLWGSVTTSFNTVYVKR